MEITLSGAALLECKSLIIANLRCRQVRCFRHVDVFLEFSSSFYDLMEVGIIEKALSKHTVIVTCSL